MAGKQQYDDTNRGALFKNDRKSKDTDRDYSGSLNVGGHDYWISAWIKTGRNGKFMSLSVKQKDGQPDQQRSQGNQQGSGNGSPPPRRSIKEDMDDEIPFAPEFR